MLWICAISATHLLSTLFKQSRSAFWPSLAQQCNVALCRQYALERVRLRAKMDAAFEACFAKHKAAMEACAVEHEASLRILRWMGREAEEENARHHASATCMRSEQHAHKLEQVPSIPPLCHQGTLNILGSNT